MTNLIGSTNDWQTSLKRDKREPRFGLLGAVVGGVFRIRVDGDNSRYHVRFNDGSDSEILHKGRITPPPEDQLTTVESQNIPVSVGWDVAGDYAILEPKSADMQALISFFGPTIFGVAYTPGSGIGLDFTDPLHPVIYLNIAGLTEDTSPTLSTTYIPARTAAGDRKIRADHLSGGSGATDSILTGLDGSVLVGLDGRVLQGLS